MRTLKVNAPVLEKLSLARHEDSSRDCLIEHSFLSS